MIDKNKQYRTRDGREVRIYAVDGCGTYPVQGAILEADGWCPEQWTDAGLWNREDRDDENDLIEVRPRIQREVWVNVYRDPRGGYHESKYEADRYGGNRIACVKLVIDVEEGEGL